MSAYTEPNTELSNRRIALAHAIDHASELHAGHALTKDVIDDAKSFAKFLNGES